MKKRDELTNHAVDAIRIFAAAKAHQESDCRKCKGGQAMVCMRAVALAEEWDKRWKRVAKDFDPDTVEVSPTGKLTLRPPISEPGAGGEPTQPPQGEGESEADRKFREATFESGYCT